MTIIRDPNLLGILKGAEALARQIVARNPHLFPERAAQQTPAAAPVAVGTDPADNGMLPLDTFAPQKRTA